MVAHLRVILRRKKTFISLVLLTFVLIYWMAVAYNESYYEPLVENQVPYVPWITTPDPQTTTSPPPLPILPDIMDYPPLLSATGNNIFFHVTNDIPDGIVTLSPRQACAVESAARMNPDLNIFVTFTADVGFRNTTAMPTIDAVLAYPNVHLNHVDLKKFAAGTEVLKWIIIGVVERSQYNVAHTSDFLRLLSLWRYGGTYMDIDTITLKKLDVLKGSNSAAAEEAISIANGFLHIEGEQGKELAKLWLDELGSKYNPMQWAANGPALITRVTLKICGAEKVMEILNGKRCQYNFRVLPIDMIFNIMHYEKHKYLEEQYMDEVLERLQNSLIAHVWHTSTIELNKQLRNDSNVPYVRLAREYCPNAIASSEFFV